MAVSLPGYGPVSHYIDRADGGAVHRSAVTAADKLTAPVPTLADIAANGTLLNTTLYRVAVSAFTEFGPSTASAAVDITTGAAPDTHKVRVTIAAVTGADGYDIFLSTAAAPLWVGRITAAQLTAGAIISAVGTVISPAVAGTVDVAVVGTGVASTAAPFAVNNAYSLDGITGIECTLRRHVNLNLELAVTDLRSAPTLRVVAFWKNQKDGLYVQGDLYSVPLLSAVGESLRRRLDVEAADGATGFILAVDAISGQGASLTAWTEVGQ